MTTATTTPAGERALRLRELANTDLLSAQDAAWGLLQRLGNDLPGLDVEAELAALFASGAPADVDGRTDGVLLGWTTPSEDLDRTGASIQRVARTAIDLTGLMPWLGKKFDQEAQRGTNSLSRSAVALTAAIAPAYRLRRVGDHWEGFDMLNRVEESVIAAGTDVLVLDYETIGTNPWPINRIRDEAVQLVPGVFLGAKLWQQDAGYRQLAWWAARLP